MLALHSARVVKFPANNEEFRANFTKFFRIARFPNVAGCVDCTHIKIKNPGGNNAEVFRNRKGFFFLNVQVRM